MQCPNCDSTTDYERIAQHWATGCGYPEIPEDVRTVLDGLVLAGATVAGQGSNRHLKIGTVSQTLADWTADQTGRNQSTVSRTTSEK